jgi:hypothetical protein
MKYNYVQHGGTSVKDDGFVKLETKPIQDNLLLVPPVSINEATNQECTNPFPTIDS